MSQSAEIAQLIFDDNLANGTDEDMEKAFELMNRSGGENIVSRVFGEYVGASGDFDRRISEIVDRDGVLSATTDTVYEDLLIIMQEFLNYDKEGRRNYRLAHSARPNQL